MHVMWLINVSLNNKLTYGSIWQLCEVYGANWLKQKLKGSLDHYLKVQGVFGHFFLLSNVLYKYVYNTRNLKQV